MSDTATIDTKDTKETKSATPDSKPEKSGRKEPVDGLASFLEAGRASLHQDPASTQKEPDEAKAEKSDPAKSEDNATAKKADESKDKASDKKAPDLEAALKKQTSHNAKLFEENKALKGSLSDIQKELKDLKAYVKGEEVKEPPKPSPEEEAAKIRFQEKDRVSRTLFVKEFGQEKLDELVAQDSPLSELMTKPEVRNRIYLSDSPYHEAAKVLEEESLFEKYGTRDIARLLEKHLEANRETIKKALLEEIKGTIPKGRSVSTLASARGGGIGEDKAENKDEARSLSAMFPHAS